jgi:hypothetical protein
MKPSIFGGFFFEQWNMNFTTKAKFKINALQHNELRCFSQAAYRGVLDPPDRCSRAGTLLAPLGALEHLSFNL